MLVFICTGSIVQHIVIASVRSGGSIHHAAIRMHSVRVVTHSASIPHGVAHSVRSGSFGCITGAEQRHGQCSSTDKACYQLIQDVLPPCHLVADNFPLSLIFYTI
jgi:hypothetical protein